MILYIQLAFRRIQIYFLNKNPSYFLKRISPCLSNSVLSTQKISPYNSVSKFFEKFMIVLFRFVPLVNFPAYLLQLLSLYIALLYQYHQFFASLFCFIIFSTISTSALSSGLRSGKNSLAANCSFLFAFEIIYQYTCCCISFNS